MQFKAKIVTILTVISKSGIKANISKISPLIPPRPSKKIQEKLKFYKGKQALDTLFLNSHLYAQPSKNNINNIVKIKENFPKLSNKKVKEVYKIINNSKKEKPKLNMMTKGLLRKQVIIPINSIITNRFIMIFNKHVENINRVLKSIKLDVIANFI